MTITIMKTTFHKQESKIVIYRDYNNIFINVLREDLLLETSSNHHLSEPVSLSSFITAGVNARIKHAPVKKKYVRTNQAPFMNENLKKAIMHRTKLRNTFLKNSFDQNKINYKKHMNLSRLYRKKKMPSPMDVINNQLLNILLTYAIQSHVFD